MGAKSKVKRREKGELRIEPPPEYEKEISDFLAWVQLEKGLSKNTVSSYENDLIQCALHLKGQGVASWHGVELIHLSGWLGSLTDEEYLRYNLTLILCFMRGINSNYEQKINFLNKKSSIFQNKSIY